ncbi:excinuclease ABC subunit UvrA [Pelagicoccus sp. SDUM812002]|uniref:excinuclease ABC subunit UvrA n=1 Tax=Pelagicoccus sp. SDUM812002 TaxID=3041266 RepID=UPI00280D5502|nr:excinuclease ABC subunit UvrA [Pelagicoccus sp. SDUM812002]MDQ8188202.1 excinuclease ABC subunit UvrA [Pelagicoccus sp. SDUM812002]
MSQSEYIHIKGAREHNLKNIEVKIPRNKLVVITGVSGSGKSSLAFDTLYAEGHRKYVESLSTQARQAMDQLKRPDVDFIHGLSPVLAIEQRASNASPRSTVATVTEISDYARLLWVIRGEQRCPKDGGIIQRQTLDDAVDQALQLPERARAMILAPYMNAKPAVLREELPRLRQKGFQRVRIDGEIVDVDSPDAAAKGRSSVQMEIVVDRLVIGPEQRSRLADSLELAFSEGKDRALVLYQESKDGSWEELSLSRNFSCGECGTVYEPVTPRHFSFNTAEGSCPECGGLGETRRFLDELVVPDPSKSVKGGALKPLRIGGKQLIIRHNALLRQLAEQLPFDPTTPWKELPKETRHQLLHGVPDREFEFKLTRRKTKTPPAPFEGVVPILTKAARETKSDGYRARLMTYQTEQDCPCCHGHRFSPRSANVFVDGVSMPEFLAMDIEKAYAFVAGLDRSGSDVSTYGEVIEGIEFRLRFLKEVGLDYLTLNRGYSTLSGGESQRVRLATQLGMSLMGVVYVLDEPSIGLHAKDNKKLVETLKELRDVGNSVVVVEHDEEMMRAADHLIEIGPGAGLYGGEVLYEGKPEECVAVSGDVRSTGAYLSGEQMLSRSAKRLEPAAKWIEIKEASHHNLKSVTAQIPVGLLTCVTGVSGSGKSTLVNQILAKAAARKLNRAKDIPGVHKGIDGLEHFERVVRVSQEPIGQSPRSNPATYTKLFDALRDLYTKVPLSRTRGYKAGRFSFNARGGRCERCQGQGSIKLDMLFMSDAYIECPSCNGKRYNRETLEAKYSGINIAEALDLSVDEACEKFKNVPRIIEKLNTLEQVGLGYLKLGQAANTLSGGEAQRLKLSLELSKRNSGKNLYILDEPTTGLHWADIQRLSDLLFRLRDQGNTVVVIEHHLDFIKLADWAIDLGPGGGSRGGEIVYSGPVDGLAKCKRSETGAALR